MPQTLIDTLLIRASVDSDKEKLIQFRTMQYKTAEEFSLQDYRLLEDMQGVSIIVEYEDSIIATMQMVEIATVKKFEEVTDIPLLENEVLFNTLYLGKAATDKRYRSMGLNSLIRKYILEYALQHSSIQSFTASVYQTAPRLRLLERMGYSFRVIPDYYPDYLTENECYLVHLPSIGFRPALDIMNNELQILFTQYHIEFIPWW